MESLEHSNPASITVFRLFLFKKILRKSFSRDALSFSNLSFYKIFKPELWSLQWKNAPHKLARIRLLSVTTTYQWSAAIT
jgi:hypothetical protein